MKTGRTIGIESRAPVPGSPLKNSLPAAVPPGGMNPLKFSSGDFAENGADLRRLLLFKRAAWRRAFTLIEIMVVMVLLTVIIIGLMAMFSETQRAFRAGMAQTDQLEAGRMFTDLLSRDIEQIAPSYQTNGVNFYSRIPDYAPLLQALPGSTLPRTNILEDVFFLTRYNQTWSGIGYFVRTNSDFGVNGYVPQVGTLYRFETNMSVTQFRGQGRLPFFMYLNATNRFSISKVLDGVVEFRVHCYDTNGTLIVGDNGFVPLDGDDLMTKNPYVEVTNSVSIAPGEVQSYAFSNNIVPAYVEVQLGILEPAILQRYNSIPDPITRSNYLASHAGNVQLFRQRIAIRNVDPLAYVTNNFPPPVDY